MSNNEYFPKMRDPDYMDDSELLIVLTNMVCEAARNRSCDLSGAWTTVLGNYDVNVSRNHLTIQNRVSKSTARINT